MFFNFIVSTGKLDLGKLLLYSIVENLIQKTSLGKNNPAEEWRDQVLGSRMPQS